jgi:hypothetical protein
MRCIEALAPCYSGGPEIEIGVGIRSNCRAGGGRGNDPFKETDTNSLTGKAVRGTGRLTETLDLLTGTRTVVGKPFVMTEPGSAP